MYQDITVVKRREGMGKHGWFEKKRHFNYDFIISSRYVILIFILYSYLSNKIKKF